MRILLVEDEEAIATLVRRTFHREGLMVVCAQSVRAALDLLQGPAFDVAILDRSLSDGSGLEIIDAIRETASHADTHVMMLSGAASERDRIEALDRGADDYVVKPFFVRELVARVTAIGRRKRIHPIGAADLGLSSREQRAGTLVHVHGVIRDADADFVELIGATSKEQLLGRIVYDLVAPDSLPAARARYETAREGTWPGSQTLVIRSLDDRELFVEVSSEHVVWNGEDASNLHVREVEPASARWRQLSTGVFSEVSDAVIITDARFHILSWNTAACELYGWPESQVLGRSINDVLPWDGEPGAVERAAADLATLGHWHGNARQVTSDGTPVQVAASVRTLTDDAGQTVAIVSVNRPVPEAVAAETSDLADTTLAELRNAIASGQIEVHHQPLVHLHDRRIVGTEALVRWMHPTMGSIPAGQFVIAAERNGGIIELAASCFERRADRPRSGDAPALTSMWL